MRNIESFSPFPNNVFPHQIPFAKKKSKSTRCFSFKYKSGEPVAAMRSDNFLNRHLNLQHKTMLAVLRKNYPMQNTSYFTMSTHTILHRAMLPTSSEAHFDWKTSNGIHSFGSTIFFEKITSAKWWKRVVVSHSKSRLCRPIVPLQSCLRAIYPLKSMPNTLLIREEQSYMVLASYLTAPRRPKNHRDACSPI